MDQEYLHKRFVSWAKEIWENYEKTDPEVEVVILGGRTKSGTIMALAYSPPKPTAYGNSIFRPPKKMRLLVSQEALSLDPETVEKLIIHEVIHIGHSNHSKEFYAMVKKYGGAYSENLAKGGSVSIQIKEGSRFKTIKEVNSPEEARSFMEQYYQEHPNTRIRWVG